MEKIALATLIAFSAACGSGTSDDPSDPANNGGKEDSLYPTGTDNAARLVVRPLTPPDGWTSAPLRMSSGNILVKPNETRRLTPGAHRLYLDSTRPGADWGWRVYEWTEMTINAGETQDVKLAGVNISQLPSFEVAFGPAPKWYILWGHQELSDWAAKPNQFVQVLPRMHQAELYADQTKLTQVDLDTKAGELLEATADYPDPRVRFIPSAPERTLPHAYDFRRVLASKEPLENVAGSHEAVSSKFEKEGRSFWDGQWLSAVAPSLIGYHYYVLLNGSYTELVGNPGETVSIPVRRLDVHHPQVTQEDGTIVSTPGKWSLTWMRPLSVAPGTFEPRQIGFDQATGTGVDLLPGKYVVYVTYERVSQPSPVTDTYEIELK